MNPPEKMGMAEKLARPAIVKMAAYKSARSLATEGEVFLDANESPFLPDLRDAAACRVNRYPEPQPKAIVAQLASIYGVRPAQILVGGGADDAIDALVRVFCEAGREGILICPPTYGVYEVAADIQGAFVDKLTVRAQDGFAIDARTVIASAREGVKLVFICTPNNPTGNTVPAETIAAICRGLRGRALVVVDEAYVEFADTPSMAAAIDELANLVVLRTLSKAWAMAGARCGVALGHADVIALLQKVRAPYPISSPSAVLVAEALSPGGRDACAARVARIRGERGRLAASLAAIPLVEKVFPSEANFILLKARDAGAFLAACRRRGVIVRDRSGDPGLQGYIRVSVGSAEENDILLEALRGN